MAGDGQQRRARQGRAQFHRRACARGQAGAHHEWPRQHRPPCRVHERAQMHWRIDAVLLHLPLGGGLQHVGRMPPDPHADARCSQPAAHIMALHIVAGSFRCAWSAHHTCVVAAGHHHVWGWQVGGLAVVWPAAQVFATGTPRAALMRRISVVARAPRPPHRHVWRRPRPRRPRRAPRVGARMPCPYGRRRHCAHPARVAWHLRLLATSLHMLGIVEDARRR